VLFRAACRIPFLITSVIDPTLDCNTSLPYSANACTFSRDAATAFGKLRIMSALKLCVLSSEILPYAKTGGLADVSGALVQNLRRLGHEVFAFMPLYSAVRAAHPELQPVLGVQQVPLAIGEREYRFSLQTASFPGTDIPIFKLLAMMLLKRKAARSTARRGATRFLLRDHHRKICDARQRLSSSDPSG